MPRLEVFKIEWDAHEYEHKERNQDWFWAVGIIAVAVAIASIIFGNIIFGILVLIGTFALTLFANRIPDQTHITINEKGIARGNIFYPYATLESFWIDTEHSHQKIILKSQKMLMPLITVPLGEEIDIDDLHEKLSKHLLEKFHSLPFVETVLEYAGF